MTAPLDPSISLADFCAAWDVSPRKVTHLVKTGQVGHYRGRKRTIRFLPEHLAQLREVLEVKARPAEPTLASQIGQSSRSAAIHRRRKSA